MSPLKFIVYSPPYDENVGGAIVLHKLCDMLNELGYHASLWPFGKRPFTWRGALYYLAQAAIRLAKTHTSGASLGWKKSRLPFANTSKIQDAIVIYPETVLGNPLSAPHYVRWFLHNPTFHTGIERDFDGELYFYFIQAFQQHLPKAVCGGRLTLLEYFRSTYRFENAGARHKVCYLLRKGKSRDDLPSSESLWVVDGLAHKEMARAFNECAICFIYDPYTLYATYAALCGCIPVIVPLAGVTKEQWLPEERLRYGLAYGEDDIPYAVATRGQLINRLEADEEENREMVKRFVKIVTEYFFCTVGKNA